MKTYDLIFLQFSHQFWRSLTQQIVWMSSTYKCPSFSWQGRTQKSPDYVSGYVGSSCNITHFKDVWCKACAEIVSFVPQGSNIINNIILVILLYWASLHIQPVWLRLLYTCLTDALSRTRVTIRRCAIFTMAQQIVKRQFMMSHGAMYLQTALFYE